ncbi:hypothetical protein EZV62_027910 [Acer yangbiense]|uniref:Uncharacterized protein n=1 Tax=Acer yangbiense TaxID=1000413 RepID=A0A5C7GP36_9ROSI|nr:hypothetical protein EZV62_027910 [Acer yangbiense]
MVNDTVGLDDDEETVAVDHKRVRRESGLALRKLENEERGAKLKKKARVLVEFYSTTLAAIVIVIDAIPINKQLYSFSHVCFTAGAADWCLGMEDSISVPGMDAMLVFVLGAQGILA